MKTGKELKNVPLFVDGVETKGDIPAGASVVIPPNKIAGATPDEIKATLEAKDKAK